MTQHQWMKIELEPENKLSIDKNTLQAMLQFGKEDGAGGEDMDEKD